MAISPQRSKSHKDFKASRWLDNISAEMSKAIPVEVPVSLVYNGLSHVVMMASPADLEDFGLGFSLSENIVSAPDDIRSLDVLEGEKGLVISMEISGQAHRKIAARRRYLSGRTGCGLCGVESLDEALPTLRPVDAQIEIRPAAIYAAFDSLHEHQPEKQATGAVHGAAWCSIDGDIIQVREDVGRHNALDKLIGAMARDGLDCTAGFCLITSRCSYEMVQKAVQTGIPLLAAISAPTTLAVQIAAENNMTLLALAREKTFTIFAHGHRIKS